jgi:alpha-D-ribose 1-methylphosphonate 5-triphosphate diphosphatase
MRSATGATERLPDMTSETVLTNARIVLADEVIDGSLVMRYGKIADIAPGATRTGEDMDGDFVIPGLVELHTDHLEGHYAPRPKVRWNPIASVLAHDAQVATAGITTVFDALRVGMDQDGNLGIEDMRKLADAIEDSSRQDRLRADHFIHLRCEVSAPDCLEGFAHFDGDSRVRLASLMDHAPGQRQFARLEAYAMYYMGKLKMSEEAFKTYCEKRMAESALNSAPNRAAIAAACQARGIILASHDDATVAHVDEAVTQGIKVAEFPTTAEAAKASRDAGLGVLMGAPNIMRGGSHSGNVSARSLAEDGLLDILSSDYIPFSLIQSAFFLGEVVDAISLPQAVAMVSKTPAEAVGLSDRGAIETGRRADLVRVRVDEHVPVVRTVWREGRRVA